MFRFRVRGQASGWVRVRVGVRVGVRVRVRVSVGGRVGLGVRVDRVRVRVTVRVRVRAVLPRVILVFSPLAVLFFGFCSQRLPLPVSGREPRAYAFELLAKQPAM